MTENLANPPSGKPHRCTSFCGPSIAKQVRSRPQAGAQAGNSMNVAVCMSVYLYIMLWSRRIDQVAYD